MGEVILAWLVVDENDKVWSVHPCDGLAYEWKDSLEDKYPSKKFHIEKRTSRGVQYEII